MITLQNLAATRPPPLAATSPADSDAAGSAPAQFAAVLAGQRAIAANAKASKIVATKPAPTMDTATADPADPASAPAGFAALLAGQVRVAGNERIALKEAGPDAIDAAAPAPPDASATTTLPDAPLAPAAQDAPAANADGHAMTGVFASLPATPAAAPAVTPTADPSDGKLAEPAGTEAMARETRPGSTPPGLHAGPPGTGKSNQRVRSQSPEFELRDAARTLARDAAATAVRQIPFAGEAGALPEYARAGEPGEPAPVLTVAAHPQSPIRDATHPATQNLHLEAPLGSARWGEQLSNQVIVLVRDGTPSADIRITPPELGPVHLRISVEDGIASVVLSAPAQETRQALEAALPALRDAFAESGITLGDSAVSEERLAHQNETRAERERRESPAAEFAATLDAPVHRQRVGLLDLYA